MLCSKSVTNIFGVVDFIRCISFDLCCIVDVYVRILLKLFVKICVELLIVELYDIDVGVVEAASSTAFASTIF